MLLKPCTGAPISHEAGNDIGPRRHVAPGIEAEGRLGGRGLILIDHKQIVARLIGDCEGVQLWHLQEKLRSGRVCSELAYDSGVRTWL